MGINIKKNKLFEDIFSKKINPFKLPKEVYEQTGKEISKGVEKGYKATIFDFDFGTPDYELLKEFHENIYIFSAAKTFRQVKEISDAILEGDRIRTFSEFKKEASEIFDKYNESWLESEYNTALASAQNGKKWNRYNFKLYPYLRYEALDTACPICRPFDGKVIHVSDSFWERYYPPNHFNCFCLAIEIDKEEGEEKKADDISELKKHGKEAVPSTFKMNVGTDRVIFKTEGKGKHPFFDIEKGYREFAKTNFGLPIPPIK